MICTNCGCEVNVEIVNLSPEQIINIVCQFFNLSQEQIKKKVRYRDIVYPRQVCYYLLKKYSSLNGSQISRLFDQDHTTFIHSANVIEDLKYSDKIIRNEVEVIEKLVMDHNTQIVN